MLQSHLKEDAKILVRSCIWILFVAFTLLIIQKALPRASVTGPLRFTKTYIPKNLNNNQLNVNNHLTLTFPHLPVGISEDGLTEYKLDQYPRNQFENVTESMPNQIVPISPAQMRGLPMAFT